MKRTLILALASLTFAAPLGAQNLPEAGKPGAPAKDKPATEELLAKAFTGMKRTFIPVLVSLVFAIPLVAQNKPDADKPAAPIKDKPASEDMLEKTLTEMDESSANFRTAEVDFVWTQYQKVVDDTDVQKGKGWFRRTAKETQMAAEITSKEHKYIVYSEGKVKFYQPKINQITEYDATTHKTEIESFLVLGFGGRGHDLPKQFHVKYLGSEKINGVDCAKLELIPKAKEVLNMFARIVLWVDTKNDVSLKQQAFEPSGDYRIAVYSGVQMNGKINDDVFKIKPTGKPNVVKP